eukprot:5863291-Pyramimonas_sp.AAC.1
MVEEVKEFGDRVKLVGKTSKKGRDHTFRGLAQPILQYLVELFVVDELEEFRRGVELVPRRALRNR